FPQRLGEDPSGLEIRGLAIDAAARLSEVSVRRFAAVANLGRDRSKADIGRSCYLLWSDAIDPKRTKAGLKSRSAAGCCQRASLWGAAAPKPIQNNSGLAQGLAGVPIAG